MKHLEFNEQIILRYIYGEMSAEEVDIFEAQMKNDAPLREEVDAMLKVRDSLRTWEDSNVTVPSLDQIDLPVTATGFNGFGNWPFWMKIAASVVVIMCLGWLTDLQVKKQDNALIISFGPEKKTEDVRFTQIEQKIDLMFAKYAGEIEEQVRPLYVSNEKLQQKLDNADTDELYRENNLQLKKLSDEIAAFESSQLGQINEAISGLADNQNDRFQEFFINTIQYMEDRRKEDMVRLENAFIQLSETMNLQQYENDQLLNNLLTSNNY